MFKNYKTIKTPIKGKGNYTLWVADTDAKRKKGLRGIDKLPNKYGMIFIYPSPTDHAFTMKGVKMPLTLYFLDRKFNVIEQIYARPNQTGIKPQKPYTYVIEI